MSSIEKLINKLMSHPKDFSYDELKTVLKSFGYVERQRGKTSGSAVEFYNPQIKKVFQMHKPHPSKILKRYQINLVITHLKENGFI